MLRNENFPLCEFVYRIALTCPDISSIPSLIDKFSTDMLEPVIIIIDPSRFAITWFGSVVFTFLIPDNVKEFLFVSVRLLSILLTMKAYI